MTEEIEGFPVFSLDMDQFNTEKRKSRMEIQKVPKDIDIYYLIKMGIVTSYD